VTDILAQECNGKLLCSVGVNVATFGPTNCGGGENLYIEYRCRKINYFLIYYTIPENTTGKQFSQEKTIIEQ
jgi:hypothetical protein